MGVTKYDKTFDEMLKGKVFEGVDALEYLKKDFTDDEIECLTKSELINLFTKAFVVICLQLNEGAKLEHEIAELYENAIEQLKLNIKHYEIYPDLIKINESDTHFELAKIEARLRQLKSEAYIALVKELPAIKGKARKAIPSEGGKARAANDERSKALKKIETEDYPANKHLFHLRGWRNKFINEMFVKYKVFESVYSITRLVDRLNKSNGITQKKSK